MKRETIRRLLCVTAIAAICVTGVRMIMPTAVVAAPADQPKPAAADDVQKQIAQLQQQIKALEGLVPDQAAVMAHVAYHFTNLYIAVQKENWPLADFTLARR